MTTLELKYNPFDLKTVFLIDGKETSLECCGTGKNIRLRDYIDKFFPAAIKKSNLGPGEDCVVQFFGTQDAFEDVKKAHQEYKAEGIKIELPPYKPYPYNFDKVNILIDEKKKNYVEQVEHKKEGLVNPSNGKSNVNILDIFKRFDRDKDTIEQLYNDNIEKTNSEMKKVEVKLSGYDKTLYGRLRLPNDNIEKIKSEMVEEDVVSLLSIHFLDYRKLKEEVGNNPVTDAYEKASSLLTGFLGQYSSLARNEAIVYHDKIKEYINPVLIKSFSKLLVHLRSLLEKIDAALYSGFESICKDYSDFLVLNYALEKYKQSSEFDIKEAIPDSCFRNKPTSEISIDEFIKTLDRTISLCRYYFISVFKSAKKDFLLETEKCRDYYLNELLKLQALIIEKQNEECVKARLIEQSKDQEIIGLEKNIECLDELQNEINKLEEDNHDELRT